MALIDDLQTALDSLHRRVWIFQDPIVGTHCSASLQVSLSECDKTLATAQKLWTFLDEHHAVRDDVIVNIGGGVLCDVGGFVASTYLRGMNYINVPTTLLSMVDASIGGKTGLNFNGRKNVIGVIREPLETWHYLPFLKTLPKDELLSGFGEIIKTALLFSNEELDVVEKALAQLDEPQRLYYQWPRIIMQSVRIKQMYVSQDLQDRGVRHALNFGHTIGHAYEQWQLRQGKRIPHGIAVMYGLVHEVALSVKHKHCPNSVYDRVRTIWEKYYATLCPDQPSLEDLSEWLLNDKKNAADGRINFTLLTNIGQPVINCKLTLEQLFLINN